jgi:hypothetical protein
MCMDAQVPWSPWMDENGLSLITKSMVALPVSSRREIVNPARPGREQRQQWIRVPGSRRVWAAALFPAHDFQLNLSQIHYSRATYYVLLMYHMSPLSTRVGYQYYQVQNIYRKTKK